MSASLGGHPGDPLGNPLGSLRCPSNSAGGPSNSSGNAWAFGNLWASFCGEVYWLGVNATPFLLAWVAELQWKIPNGARGPFATANNIVKLIKQNQHISLQIYHYNHDDLAVFTRCDAAWASRPGGHSQRWLPDGACSDRSNGWRKSAVHRAGLGLEELRQVAPSSAAAEVQQAGDAEGEQCGAPPRDPGGA
eukprot:9150858-Pyramimonas_sp.AAC.1